LNFHLSPEALAALGCLAGVVVLSGAALWAAWRRGSRSRGHITPIEKVDGPSFNRTWEKENAQFAELARKADELRRQNNLTSSPDPSPKGERREIEDEDRPEER
jgi:hypothetical protein